MPLIDVTFIDKLVDISYEESTEFIKTLQVKLPAVTFNKIIRIIDEAIDSVKPTKTTQLTWTKTGALFGHKSERPLRDVNYVWEKVISAVGDGKNCLRTMGNLMRWRTALRPEIWLVFRQDMGGIDLDTGKTIRVSNYWIDNNYQNNGINFKTKVELASPASLVDFAALADKFGSRAGI